MEGQYTTSHLEQLEAESIYILREVASEFEKPVLLYSVGKDSSVLIRLAQKAFYPGKIPFPLMHIDTGFKFKEMYTFRDQMAKDIGFDLITHRNETAIKNGTNPHDLGTSKCCAQLKTAGLLHGLTTEGFDSAIGGARRDEEKSRAKERICSFRDKFGQWDPKNQRPELWSLYNCQVNPGESIRVFPISNWTELNIWHYIHKESIPIVPLYYAQKRKVIRRGGMIIPVDEHSRLLPNDKEEELMCRYRSLGCTPCTGAMESNATTVPEIIEEMMLVRNSERASRAIDHDVEGSMELKKREGYF